MADGATRWVDEQPWGFGWWVEGDRLVRTAHALRAGDGVWVIDPVAAEGAEERVRELGEPRGVIQLLDRHGRDAAGWATRLGVPLHVVPLEPVGPFELVPLVRARWWKEAALWWPEERVLVAADALGAVGYFRGGGDGDVGVHPLLRLRPPRALLAYEPRHVLVGHGRGGHGEHVAAAVHDAIRNARRRLPSALGHAIRGGRNRR